MQATLVVRWVDYGDFASWDAFTAGGCFLNHDPVNGHTVYAADMMVHPKHQHHGLSRALVEARLLERRRLERLDEHDIERQLRESARERGPDGAAADNQDAALELVRGHCVALRASRDTAPREAVRDVPSETVSAQGCADPSPADGLPACLGRDITHGVPRRGAQSATL